MPRKKWFLRLSLAALAFIVVCAGRILVRSEAPEKADLLLVLMGSREERSTEAAHLLRQGFASRVSFIVPFSGPEPRPHLLVSERELALQVFRRRGIDSALIEVLPGPASSTLMEALYFADYCSRHPEVRQVLVVTSTYHSRRAALIFDDVFRQRGLKTRLVFPLNRSTPFRYWLWWSSLGDIRITVTEYAKFLYYLGYTRWVGPAKPFS